MRILVPLKTGTIVCAWFRISLVHSLICSPAPALSFSLRAHSIELNKLSVRGSFNAAASHSRSTRSLAHSDGWMDRIRSRHCTHNMLDDSHFSEFSDVCVVYINRVYITLLHTKRNHLRIVSLIAAV